MTAVRRTTRTIRRWNHLHLAALLLAISLVLTILISGLLYLLVALDLPAIVSLASYHPPATTFFYDDQGTEIASLYKENRIVVPLARVPTLVGQAFVAAEDDRFFEHQGVDGWSILRALAHNLRTGHRSQGGSTITQQVARSLLLSPEKTYTRKLKEAILAYRIDRALSKQEILHIYLNQIYLGNGAYGVEAAARTYFDKHVWELNLAETALLAGLPQAPSRYSPFRHYKLAKKRQAYVLNRMAAEGYITPTAARRAYRQPLLWAPSRKAPPGNDFFLQEVINTLSKKYGRERLRTGGLRIHTTLNRRLQRAANQAVRRGVSRWQAMRQAQDGQLPPPQAALVAMEVTTGKVMAVVGGTNFRKSQYNRATQARRQPGSAFKPFIYAAALAQGLTPATILLDEPLELRGSAPGKSWRPRNFSNSYHGPTTLRDGLVYSRNIVTIKLLQQTGVRNTIKLARKLGIHSPLAANLSLALGASEVSVLEMTAAYAALANHGVFLPPTLIKQVYDRDGHLLEEHHPVPSQVLDPRTAYQVTHLLESVIEEGTGKSVRSLGVPAAGKTGTTDRYMDAWFIGYTPKLAVGVWVGHDQKISLGPGGTGARVAGPVWLAVMRAAQAMYPSGDFQPPPGITLVPIDNRTGHPCNDYLPSVSWEAFRTDQLPWPVSQLRE